MKITYAIFYTNSIEKIEDFYTKVIGLQKAFGNNRFVAFKVGEVLLGIKMQEHEREIPGHQTAIIEVDNIDAQYQELKSKGVTIYKELTAEEWGKNFAVLDIDGNKVEFVQK